MPWGPWIQLENKRVGKWIGASEQGRLFGGAVDEDGSVFISDTELDDAWSVTGRGLLSLGETETTPVDSAKEIAARDLALTRTGQSQTINVTGAEGTVASAAVTPPDSAVFTDAAAIQSGLAYINEPDSFHWLTEHPDYVGQPYEYHPDDVAPSANADFGEVLSMWISVAWNTGLATSDPFYDGTPTIIVGDVDPSTVAQAGFDSGYDFRVDAWPDSMAVTAGSLGTGSTPPAIVGDYGFIGPFSAGSRTGLEDRGTETTIPYLFTTNALLAWGWAVDGTTVREAHFPLFGRIITDFYYRPARFRLWRDSTVVPPLRQYPRDDTLAVGTPRLWPPPQSQQHSPARLDGYF